MVCSSVLLLLMLFGVLRGVKLMLCFTKVMSPPPFCVFCQFCVCCFVGVLWWLASFVSCTVAISMLLVFMMCASSASFLCIPFMLICRILRSCLFCCADCDCWWLVTGVIWGVLGVGALVVEAIWGVAGADALVAACWCSLGAAVYGLIDTG